MTESKKPKTKIEVALELYAKKYNVYFISEFLGVDVMTIKSWVFKDDPKKTLKKPEDVPDKINSVEKSIEVSIVKKQIAEDMPSIIRGLTLVGYSLAEIAKEIGVPEDLLFDAVEDIEEVADAYNYAKKGIHMKVVETLFSSLMPRELIERRYKMAPIIDKDGKITKWEKYLDKEITKEYSGNVEGMFKWLEVMAPEKWSPKQKALKDLLIECGIAMMPKDVEEAEWSDMAVRQQDTLNDVLDDEKRRIVKEIDADDDKTGK